MRHSLTLVALAAVLLASVSVEAQQRRICADRAKLLAHLETKHDEVPHGIGLSDDGGVIELLVGPEGNWTIIITYPKRPTCVIAVGKAWESEQIVSAEDDA